MTEPGAPGAPVPAPTPRPAAPVPAAKPAAPTGGEGLARATAVITAARSVQMVTFLAIGMYLTRRLDSPTYGTFQHVPFLAQAIPIAVSVPVGKTILFFAPRSANPDRFLRGAALVLAGAGILAGLVLGLLPGVFDLFDTGDANLPQFRWLIAGIVGFAFAQSITEYSLMARGHRTAIAWYLLALGVWNVVSLGGAAAFAPEESRLHWLLVALLSCYALPALTTFYWLLRPSRVQAPPESPARGELVHYALPLVLAVGVNYLAAQIDKFLVPQLFPMSWNPTAKDHYFRAANEVPVLGAMALTMFGLVAPQLARLHAQGATADLLALWRKACRSVAVVSIPACGLLCAVAFEAFTLVYGDRYGPAVPIFRWYVLRLVIAVFLPQVLLESVGATGRALVFSAVSLATAVLLTIPLVGVFQLPGAAAAATLASLLANWGFGGWIAHRQLGARWHDLLDWGHLARLCATTAVAALVALYALPGDLLDTTRGWVGAVPEGTPGGTTGTRIAAHLLAGLVHGGVFAGVFVVLARLLRSVTPEDLEMLRGLVGRRTRAA